MNWLIDLIDDNEPDRWLISFEGLGVITLEHFDGDYMGEKEVGCGTWEASGSVERVLELTRSYLEGGP